jgi:hypothetical protein
MVRRIFVIAAGLLIVAVAVPVYHAGVVFNFWQPLRRPQGVSPSAHYVSLVEEGTWFKCYVDSKRSVDVCKAWDADGRLIADGDFRLEGENRFATKSELRPTHVARGDGQVWMIYLNGKEGAFSKALVPATASGTADDR